MKKSFEPPSSMELLLDAMCNVFGAVLFMAILVGGVSVVRTLMPSEGVDPAVLEQQQQTIKARQSELEVLQQRCKLIESIPQIDNEEALPLPAKTGIRELVREFNTLSAELDALQQKLDKEEKRVKYLNDIRHGGKQYADKLLTENTALQQAIKQQKPSELTFDRVGQTSELEPWRVLLTAQEIFIIGANRNIHQRSAVGSGVDITVFRDGEIDYFYLTKRPGEGIALKDFNLQLLALPQQESGKYFVEILAEPDAVANTAQLVNALRKNLLPYHWRTVPRSGATLRSSNRREYEVAR